MRIGILAQYLDTRADVRDLIRLLALENEIVIYLKASDAERITPMLSPNQRTVVLPRANFGVRILLLLWQYVYLAFGKIPRSRYNYYMVEHIRLSNKAVGSLARFVERSLITLSKYVPQFISYDAYLGGLSRLPAPLALDADIDVFFCNTQIYDDWLYAHILRQSQPVWTYVYSWDHPCKMKTFSRRTRYLVWNEGLKNDLIQLQGIDSASITVWGATQFSYLEAHRASVDASTSSYPFPYLYLGFATGYDELVVQEVRYVVSIAQTLAQILPDWKLVVRPYPFQRQWDLYAPLREIPNVIFDDSFRKNADDLAVKVNANTDKLQKIRHARAFLHFGTTMGYEACYFDVPSCLMALVDSERDALLHGFVHQYQNDRYLNVRNSPNVATSQAQFENLLWILAANPVSLLAYNQKIRQAMPLRPLSDLVRQLLHTVERQSTDS